MLFNIIIKEVFKLLFRKYTPISIINGDQLYVPQKIAEEFQNRIDELLTIAGLTGYQCEGYFFTNLIIHKSYALLIGENNIIEFEINKKLRIKQIEFFTDFDTLVGNFKRVIVFKEKNYKEFPKLISFITKQLTRKGDNK